MSRRTYICSGCRRVNTTAHPINGKRHLCCKRGGTWGKRPPLSRWYAKDIGTSYYLENDSGSYGDVQSRAHCLACAYVEVITQYGGDCDLRGLHRYGICFSFLQAIVAAERKGEPLPTEEEVEK